MSIAVGCAKPHASGTCDRAAYWVGEGDGFEGSFQREDYLAALEEAFALDIKGNPQRGAVAHQRLEELERFCWQMRAK